MMRKQLNEAEKRIIELEKHIAKSAPLTWVWNYDIDAAKKWELEGLELLEGK